MAKNSEKEVKDYRHDTSKRKNNPPAGIAGQGRTPDTPKQEYAYNPHLPPILRSDPHGDADKLPELLQKAQQEPLTPEEAKNNRRCPQTPRTLVRMGRQTGSEIFYCGSGCVACA